MPRILHLNSMLKGGGTDDRSVRIAHAVAKLGHTVWLAGPEGREYSKIATELGLKLHAVQPGALMLPLIREVARFIREQDVDLIHARHGRDYWPAVLAARLSGTRPAVVLSRHLAKSPGSWFSRWFLLSQCDAFVAVSHFVAQVLKQGHSDPAALNPERHRRPGMRGNLEKIRVVYGGFDMDRFQPAEAPAQRAAWGLAAEHYAFGLVGGYSRPYGKGHVQFLAAAASARKRLPNARFLIIGRGNMKEQLVQEIQRLGLGEVATLTPYCHDMPAAMNALDCLVLPQVGTEAIPGVVCEAHACGKPVIASDLDGIPEAFAAGGYGTLVPPADVEALARAMETQASKPPLDWAGRRELHRRTAERFSLERAATDLSALYTEILARKKPGVRAK
jgi:glycosyltransferase involved in cell wall biosynthesis